MTDTHRMIIVDENKISSIIEIDRKYEKESDLQRKIVEIFSKDYPHLIFIEPWSLESMIASTIRRKHDLVFLNIEEFPPKFKIAEVKKYYAYPENPFYFIFEAKEKEKDWNAHGVNNTESLSILYAPSFLQQSPLLSAYCAVMSFLKKSCDNKEYEMLNIYIQTLDDKEIWGIIDNDEITKMNFKELRRELKKRKCPINGSKEDLAERLLLFQNNLEKAEKTELIGIDIEISNQEWSIENGIGSIRLFQYQDNICLIVVPPNIPELKKRMFLVSNGQGGSEYWLWDLKENTYKEFDKLSDEELKSLNESGMSDIIKNISLYIVDMSEDITKYEDNLYNTELYLSEFVESWKLLSKIPQ